MSAALALQLVFLVRGEPPSPHLIFIMADDLGSNDVGWNDPTALTPELTTLARGGVVLGAAYTWSWCAPSRGAFLTGRYAPKSGFEGSGGPSKSGSGKVAVMPTTYEMLPAMLRRAPTPYTTLMAGKVRCAALDGGGGATLFACAVCMCCAVAVLCSSPADDVCSLVPPLGSSRCVS